MTPEPAGDQPRWTVDEDDVGLGPIWLTPDTDWASYEDVWELLTNAQQDDLVRCVRDAAEVPALRGRLEAAEAQLAVMSSALLWLSSPDRPDSAWPPFVLEGYDAAAKNRAAIARAQADRS